MMPLPKLVLTNVSLTLSLTLRLLLVRSLKKHVTNIYLHVTTGLLQNDILALTEIQLKQGNNSSPIGTQLSYHFSCQFNLNENKYRRIAVCNSHNVSVIDHQRCDGISVVTLIKSHLSQTPVTIAVIYRSPSGSISIFLKRVARVLEQNQIHILMGDFNVDTLNHEVN